MASSISLASVLNARRELYVRVDSLLLLSGNYICYVACGVHEN